jgi:hypothetical protein
MTIDALRAGLRVVEVEVDLHHNPTGKDLSGLLHRARQARAVARELTRRRAWRPSSNGRTTNGTGTPAAPGSQGEQTPADAGSPGWEGSPGSREGSSRFPQPPGSPARGSHPPNPLSDGDR